MLDHEKHRKAVKSMGIAIHVLGILFILVWYLVAASMGAWFMLLMAVPFAVILIFRLAFMRKPAKGDPWDMQDELLERTQSLHSAVEDVFRRTSNRDSADTQQRSSPRFCHHCRFWIHNNAQFCPKCGRQIP